MAARIPVSPQLGHSRSSRAGSNAWFLTSNCTSSAQSTRSSLSFAFERTGGTQSAIAPPTAAQAFLTSARSASLSSKTGDDIRRSVFAAGETSLHAASHGGCKSESGAIRAYASRTAHHTVELSITEANIAPRTLVAAHQLRRARVACVGMRRFEQ